MGDFNTSLKESEKMGGSQTILNNRLDLMDFIDYHLLHERISMGFIILGPIEELVRISFRSNWLELSLVVIGF